MIRHCIAHWSIRHRIWTHWFICWKAILAREFWRCPMHSKMPVSTLVSSERCWWVSVTHTPFFCIYSLWRADHFRYNLHALHAYAGRMRTWIVSTFTSALVEFLWSVFHIIRHRADWSEAIRWIGKVWIATPSHWQSIQLRPTVPSQTNHQYFPVHHATRILLRLLCICCGEFTRSRCPLFHQIRHSIVFAVAADTDDCVEFLEKFEISDARLIVCIDSDRHRWVLSASVRFQDIFNFNSIALPQAFR